MQHTEPVTGVVLALAAIFAVAAYGQQPVDELANARALLVQGRIATAESGLRSYLQQNPRSADAHFLLGFTLFREKKAVDSLAEYTAGAAIRRPSADELKTVASDYVLLGDYGDADKWFTAVTAEAASDADAWYLLGRTKYNENRFTESVTAFERALSLQPKYVEAENNLGLTLQELNKADEAKAAFRQAIEWQGDHPADPQPFLNLGTMLASEGALPEAMPLLTKAATLSPENPKVHEELGQVYESQKDLPKAQAELERAVALAPGTSGLHFKLGQIYRHEGMHDKAQREFDVCEKLNSTHSSANTPNPAASAGPTTH
jgi:tetratricopeptide (TPR) repeat protein